MKMNFKTKICVICGNEFSPKAGNQKQCNSIECRKKYKKKKYSYQKIEKEEVEYNKSSYIALVESKARQEGLSYGQYVGLYYVGSKV